MAFPLARTFILDPDNWHSLNGVVSLPAGALLDAAEYPLDHLIDGSIGPVTRFSTNAVRIVITLTGALPVNMLGVMNHNLDPQLLIQPEIDGVPLSRTFGVQYPHCWLDLREFASTATQVGITIAGNSRPISLSEIVVGSATLFEGTIEVPFPEALSGHTTRARTEYGILLEASSGALRRTLRLRLVLNPSEQAVLRTIWTHAKEDGLPVIIAPTSLRNDVWALPLQGLRVFEYGESLLRGTVQIEALEMLGGVV